jgi:predicted ATPase
MISNLGIRNFKLFTSLDLPLRQLTVLTGLNGAGKSTVLQALLLVRQAAEDASAHVVQLNGPYGLSLGEALDVLHLAADKQEIEIHLTAEETPYTYLFEVPDGRALNLPIKKRPSVAPAALIGKGTSFCYLNAERLGPRDQLDVTAEEAGLIGVGIRGEYTAQALALNETEEIRAPLRHPHTGERGVITLRTQVEAWASEIIRPIRITAQWPPGITASLIRFQEPGLIEAGLVSEQIRPANMGFGISYALPILVAGLMMPRGGLFIVENPEAHLHPAGQSRLGAFLGRVAASGVQVIIETHSDHVINGIRLAAAEEHILEPTAVILNFFSADPGGTSAVIEMTGGGGLTTWPRGFFDQIEEDLGRLARAKRHGN